MAMPDWLRRQLEASGRLDPPGSGARAASFRRCPTCSMTVLHGLDDDVMGWAVMADLRRLSSIDEAIAILAGRWTGTVKRQRTSNGYRLQLDDRDRWRTAGKPADRPGVLVLAEHRCGAPLGHHLERLLPTKGKTDDLPGF